MNCRITSRYFWSFCRNRNRLKRYRLGARLTERGSEFSAIFDALSGFAGEPDALHEIRRQAATEGEDQTLVNMDEIWEEEAVSFMGAEDVCKSQAASVIPITITPREQFKAAQNRSL
ncbi:MAG: hypothetical protein NTX38_05180 [Methylobacter sp.]|nr:hypothetical protein [Methylobacter sp.]